MKYLTQYVPQGSGDRISDGYVVVEEDGVLKAQKLSFNGTEAVPDGAAEAIGNVGLFATGLDEPAYSGSGSGTGGGSEDDSGSDNVESESCAKFYKCASVDTANKTWTGYELILQDGVYVVSDVVTEGLSYSVVTPVVGNTYSEDVLILASPYMGWKAPADGLVFYADLKDVNNTTAQTGETLTFSNATNSTQNGIPCIFFDSGYMHCPGANAPADSAPRTVSMWVKQYNTVDGEPIGGYGASGSGGQNEFFACRLYLNKIGIWGDDADWDSDYTFDQTVWHHYLWLNDGSTDKIYIDGVLAVEHGYTRYTRNDYIFIGRYGYNASTTQYATAFRIYNRALTQEEITTLANEFTPTTA